MSYVERTVSVGGAIVRGLALLLAFVVCLVIALMIYIWFASRPIHYVMHSGEPSSEQDRLNQRAALDQFQRHGACEFIGKATEWKGRPALTFSVNPDFEEEEAGCIRGLRPKGFQLEKRGWFA